MSSESDSPDPETRAEAPAEAPPPGVRQWLEQFVDERMEANRREQIKALVGRAMKMGLSRRQTMRIAALAFGMGAASSVGFYWGTEEARAAATGEEGTASDPLLKIYTAELLDDSGNTITQNVVATGQTALSSDTATVDTGISATDATFRVALGVDDPDADVKLSATLFWDDSAGTYKVEITENVGGVDPTVNYDIIRTR